MKSLFLVSAVVVLSSCAIGPSKVAVRHSPLAPTATQRSGVIAVREFRDTRKDAEPTRVGNKRNGFGMVLGSFHIKGKTIPATVTEHFSDALRAAGYQVVPHQGGNAEVVLDGDIEEFWLDLFTAVWHNVGVNLRLSDRSGRSILWQKRVDSRETNVLWLGINSEIEKVIQQAMDNALNQAAQEFASDAFASKVKNRP